MRFGSFSVQSRKLALAPPRIGTIWKKTSASTAGAMSASMKRVLSSRNARGAAPSFIGRPLPAPRSVRAERRPAQLLDAVLEHLWDVLALARDRGDDDVGIG